MRYLKEKKHRIELSKLKGRLSLIDEYKAIVDQHAKGLSEENRDVAEIKEALGGKHPEEWHAEYDAHKFHIQKWIKHHENQLRNIEEKNKKTLAIGAILAVVILSGMFFGGGLTGLFSGIGTSQTYTEELSINVTNSTYIDWGPENEGTLTKALLSGKIYGEGDAKIYLVANDTEYLIYDSDTAGSSLTGMVVGSGESDSEGHSSDEGGGDGDSDEGDDSDDDEKDDSEGDSSDEDSGDGDSDEGDDSDDDEKDDSDDSDDEDDSESEHEIEEHEESGDDEETEESEDDDKSDKENNPGESAGSEDESLSDSEENSEVDSEDETEEESEDTDKDNDASASESSGPENSLQEESSDEGNGLDEDVIEGDNTDESESSDDDITNGPSESSEGELVGDNSEDVENEDQKSGSDEENQSDDNSDDETIQQHTKKDSSAEETHESKGQTDDIEENESAGDLETDEESIEDISDDDSVSDTSEEQTGRDNSSTIDDNITNETDSTGEGNDDTLEEADNDTTDLATSQNITEQKNDTTTENFNHTVVNITNETSLEESNFSQQNESYNTSIESSINTTINESVNKEITINESQGNITRSNITSTNRTTNNVTVNITSENVTNYNITNEASINLNFSSVFKDECFESCLLPNLKGPYQIKVEVDDNTAVEVEEITYSVIQPISDTTNITNQTSYNMSNYEVINYTQYEKVEEDNQYDVIIDSAKIANGTLIVKFRHDHEEELDVLIDGFVNYTLNKETIGYNETAVMKIENYDNEYFEIYVGRNTEVFGFGFGKKFKVDVDIKNALKDTLKGKVKFRSSLTKHIRHSMELNAENTNVLIGRYDIIIEPEDAKIREVQIPRVVVNKDLGSLLEIDEFEREGKKRFVINPTQDYTHNITFSAVAEGDVLYKCASWNFTERKCEVERTCTGESKDERVCEVTGGWQRVKDIVPGEDYNYTIRPQDPAFAEFENNFGAPYCPSGESPCIAGSDDLKCRDSINDGYGPEPFQPNTIDSCTDGTSTSESPSCGGDESVENITITNLDGNYFKAGNLVNVQTTVNCWIGGGSSDNVNLVYTNNTETVPDSWQVIDFIDSCPTGGFNTLSWNFTLDNVSGNHSVRIVNQYLGSTSSTCGTGAYDDTDDVVFKVAGENSSTPPSQPNQITCDDGNCSDIFGYHIDVQCSGSVDEEDDPITYNVWAFYNDTVNGSYSIIDSSFDSSSESFSYVDDLYQETSNADYESGSWVNEAACPDGGCLKVELNKISTTNTGDFSGGWQIPLNLTLEGDVTVTFDYNMRNEPKTDAGESVSLFYKDLGTGSEIEADSLPAESTEYKSGSVNVTFNEIPEGTHNFHVGCWGADVSSGNEYYECWIDNVKVSVDSGNITYPYWHNLGNHTEGSYYSWNTSYLTGESNIDLKCRAIDLTGSQIYSDFYDPELNLTVNPALLNFIRVNSLKPTGGNEYLQNESFVVGANVISSEPISQVYANITKPDGENDLLELFTEPKFINRSIMLNITPEEYEIEGGNFNITMTCRDATDGSNCTIKIMNYNKNCVDYMYDDAPPGEGDFDMDIESRICIEQNQTAYSINFTRTGYDAGHTVEVGYHFNSTDGVNEFSGWVLNDVETYYNENYEKQIDEFIGFYSTYYNETIPGVYDVNFIATSGVGTNSSVDTNFRIIAIDNNLPPTQSNPTLESSLGYNTSLENITCNPQNVTDPEGYPVKNIISWVDNGEPYSILNMPFEGESNNSFAKDYSGYGNDGIVNGAAWSEGEGYDGYGAYNFSDDHIDLNNLDIYGDEMSISLWVRADNLDGDARLISKASSTAEQDHYWMISERNNLLRFRLKTDSTTTLIADNGTIKTGAWTHVVVSYDGTEMVIYKDGNVVGRTPKTGTISSDNSVPAWIGGNPDGSNWFDGMIDEVMIFNRSLSENQVQKLYQGKTDVILSEETELNDVWQCSSTPTDFKLAGNTLYSNNLTILQAEPKVQNVNLLSTSGFDLTTDNLTCEYEMNEFATDSIINWQKDGKGIMLLNLPVVMNETVALQDLSGKQHDFTNNGAVYLDDGSSRKGVFDFTGDGDYIVDEDGENYINGLTEITVMMWIKADQVGTDRPFFDTEDPDDDDGVLGMRYDSSGINSGCTNCIKAGIGTDISGTNNIQIESSSNTQTTEWQHITLRWSSGNEPELFIDGIKDTGADVTGVAEGSLVEATKVLIGNGAKGGTSTSWDGMIDDVRIYNRSLSEAQIKATYENKTDVIVSDETSIDDNWKCEVIPLNANALGQGEFSNNVLIKGYVPEVEVKSINLTPDDNELVGGVQINPFEGSQRVINISAHILNTTTVSNCTVRIYNETNTSNVFASLDGNVGTDTICSASFDLQYWYNPGDWEVEVYAEAGTNNSSNSTSFYYNELIGESISTDSILFVGSPGDTNISASNAFPMIVNNTGNVPINLSLKGTDFIGVSDTNYTIGVRNSTYSLNANSGYERLGYNSSHLFTELMPRSTLEVYWKGKIPQGIMSQDYQSTITIKSE